MDLTEHQIYNSYRILIFPDIHGRNFWRRPLDICLKDYFELTSTTKNYLRNINHIIFLGDYCDPYFGEYDPNAIRIRNNEYHEGDYLQADEYMLANLADIIQYKDNHKSKITLLLGNHDMHYINKTFYRMCGGSRYNMKYSEKIKTLINEDIDLFDIAWSIDKLDKTFLFTHAGVNLGWFLNHTEHDNIKRNEYNLVFTKEDVEKGPSTMAEELNKINGKNFPSLCEVAWVRGGSDTYGSPLWNDYTEMLDTKESDFVPFNGKLFQVFGHTQLKDNPICASNYVCCDCRRPFILNIFEGIEYNYIYLTDIDDTIIYTWKYEKTEN